jgi:hypothetical protein
MLAEELTHAGGYARVLAAIGRGRTRYAQIASESDQRIERPLEILMRAGLISKRLPVGAPRGARASYEIADPYLAFWFSVLYSDIPQIEAGQGRAVLNRRNPSWQRHLGSVFEDVARAHARRLATRGELPSDLVIDRWWATSGEPCEVDVLGIRGTRSVGPRRHRRRDPLQDRPRVRRARHAHPLRARGCCCRLPWRRTVLRFAGGVSVPRTTVALAGPWALPSCPAR